MNSSKLCFAPQFKYTDSFFQVPESPRCNVRTDDIPGSGGLRDSGAATEGLSQNSEKGYGYVCLLSLPTDLVLTISPQVGIA